MNLPRRTRLQWALTVAFAGLLHHASALAAPQVLIADRLTDRVLSYDADGNFTGVVLEDPNNLDEPTAITLSYDRTRLYVTSRQGDAVVSYDFDGTTASNPQTIIDSGVNGPSALLFSEDQQTLYVANLGDQGMFGFDGATVSQFDPNGNSAGPDLTGGSPVGRSGLAFDPAGNLLVSSFGDGGVLKYDSVDDQFEPFLSNPALTGAGHLLVVDNSLYVPGGFTGFVLKFDATTGDPDPAFTPISGLVFPAGITLAPNGNGFLLSSLGFVDGQGIVQQYAFDGTLVDSEFAPNSAADPNQGYAEPTALLTIFDPADFSKNGIIDGEDLAIWETAYGVNNSADADFDGDSDGLDFLIWQRETTVSLDLVTAVPEPAAGMLALLGAGVACGYRRRS